MSKNWQCRVSPTLGELEDSQNKIWGTKDYENDTDPTVFMGCYGLPDFYTIWRHKGEKHILWCGTDILHFRYGYWLDKEGKMRITSRPLATWMNKYCTNWVENMVEKEALKDFGIGAIIVPSFIGDVNKFPVSEKKTDKKRYYASVSGNNFEQYGWPKINQLAEMHPNYEYHLYGNTIPWVAPRNVKVHGRVPKEVMNKEIKSMTGCVRLLEFDGFSEVIAKAVLMGQEVISSIDYPFLKAENPRAELLAVLNKFPWNKIQNDNSKVD
jgi:hypothetical protein